MIKDIIFISKDHIVYRTVVDNKTVYEMFENKVFVSSVSFGNINKQYCINKIIPHTWENTRALVLIALWHIKDDTLLTPDSIQDSETIDMLTRLAKEKVFLLQEITAEPTFRYITDIDKAFADIALNSTNIKTRVA